jgi:glutathione S-transferase
MIMGTNILFHLINLKFHHLPPILDQFFKNDKIRQQEMWFDINFFHDVYKLSVYERTLKFIYTKDIMVNMENIKQGQKNQMLYLSKLEELFTTQCWINDNFSINDITCFSHLAALDYFGQIVWIRFPNLKKWYSRMKSNNQYNFILNKKIHINPVSYYNNFDF